MVFTDHESCGDFIHSNVAPVTGRKKAPKIDAKCLHLTARDASIETQGPESIFVTVPPAFDFRYIVSQLAIGRDLVVRFP
jgi:hypothetical protein